MNRPTLTIGIPTYNREKKIKHCLGLIAKQKRIQEVEVLVANNGSTDGTEKFLQDFHSKTKLSFQFINHKKNLGFDLNILSLYKKAKGEYIWYFSDDDEILPGAIERALNVLKKSKPDVYYPNQIDTKGQINVKNNDFLDLVPYFPTGKGMRIPTDAIFSITTDVERLAFVRLTGFISCCLTRVNKSVIKDLSEFDGTGMLQTAITSLILQGKSKGYVSGVASVRAGDKDSFSRWFMDSSLYGMTQLHYSKKLQYPKEIARDVCVNTAKFALVIMAQQKRLGVPVDFTLSKAELQRMKKTFGTDFSRLQPFIILAVLGKYTPKYIITFFFSSAYFLSKGVVSLRNKIK